MSQNIPIPSWLNIKLFEEALNEYLGDARVLVHSVKFEIATKPGDHFASTVLRAVVEYNSPFGDSCNKIMKMIVKTAPVEDNYRKDMINHLKAYETEVNMYSKVLPSMEKLLKSIGKNIKIGPM